jgi:hypothetical protein
MTRQSLISRRRVLGVFGAGTTVALAGCSGNGQEGSSNDDSGSGSTGTDSPSGSGGTSGGNGSRTEETDSGSQGTEDSGSTGSTGNEPGEYPTQDTKGTEAELDRYAANDETYFSFKIEDFDYLDVESFPDAVQENSNPFEEALYFAATDNGEFEKADSIYFAVADPGQPGEDSLPFVTMYVGFEESGFDTSRAVSGFPETVLEQEEDQYDFDVEEAYSGQEDFFRDHVDPDGIVHAVDLSEHDYAVEALHSGFGSE